MSVRAAQAYGRGEKPRSKWTKRDMLAEIHDTYADRLSDEQWQAIKRLTRTEMLDGLFYASSWHHTSKMYNRTDFYSVDHEQMNWLLEIGSGFRPTYELVYWTGSGEERRCHTESFPTARERDAFEAEHAQEITHEWDVAARRMRIKD